MDFMQYWQYTDIITKLLFFALFGLSLVSWIVGITRIMQSKKLASVVKDGLSAQLAAMQPKLANLPSGDKKAVIEQTLLQQISRYRFASEKGLAVLGTTASIAPFIGLFGTVWGIFHALHSIGESGQAGLGQVAGPVGEALIMTGLGLAVAIPAVIFYNIVIRINRKALHEANDISHELLAKSLMHSPQQ
ncbi:MotA/TolQ/ExbB proton channel [Moraxella macacae 0408225]|uniref:Biopolymer transport protein ExbB n=1 Tax=Moraxella macacae 0408225 TaxID=1230338 RepID=L2F9F7_9GAMM|nr:MotA/TolQ/ExbB proton channel family protein [Moraxella macacae]ELA09699.1 MotA/TolQ/ExbB proton channel [Moraxella macacae 0408225]